MDKYTRIYTVVLIAAFLLTGSFFLQAQEQKIDKDKIYKECSGRYEFQADQTVVLEFYVDKGILYGRQDGDNEVVELIPVETNPYAFEATDEDGQFYEILFKKNDDGEVTRCMVTTMGMELEGFRVK